MAKLIDVNTNQEVEIKDNEEIIDGAEELGVAFGCQDGRCGSCRIEVIEGMENLSDKTQNEKDAGLEDEFRLACQCKIKKDIVKIRV